MLIKKIIAMAVVALTATHAAAQRSDQTREDRDRDYQRDREIIDSQRQVPEPIREHARERVDQFEELDRLQGRK